jgi:hypothetical protein
VLYLANPSTPEVRAAMDTSTIGCIITPKQGNRRPAGVVWCADNGCFGKGYPGDDEWFGWLQRNADHASTCLFAVAPDVVGDAAATYARSLPWLPQIRELGYPAAYVAQDGQETFTPPWDEFDVLLIGGTTDWKLGRHARHLATEAKARGKWVHMGRVNSERRYRYAHAIGCDSADGTYITFGPDTNLPKVQTWIRGLDQQHFDFEEV